MNIITDLAGSLPSLSTPPAAKSDDDLSAEKLTAEFVAAGYSDRVAARDVRRNPQLAAEALGYWRQVNSLAPGTFEIGGLGEMLRNPRAWKFVLDVDGKWHRPPRLPRSVEDCQKNAVRERREQERIDRTAAWRRLSPAEQAPIAAAIERLGLTPGSALFEIKCADAWHRQQTCAKE